MRKESETATQPGETLFETAAVRLWQDTDDLVVLSFKSKMNAASTAVLDGVIEAVAFAEQQQKPLIIWQSQPPHFCVGANLTEFSDFIADVRFDAIEAAVAKFQQASLALRYASIPTLAAMRGLSLGGGCELAMHCDRRVVTEDSRMGLVELKVGLIPAGAGTKEFALRAASGSTTNLLAQLQFYYWQIARAEVATDAADARKRKLLTASDITCEQPEQLLETAKQQARELLASDYQPPERATQIPVVGAKGIDVLQAQLNDDLAAERISAYDYQIAQQLAVVICGGEIDFATEVDEQHLLQLERQHFVMLAKNALTHLRIQYMLQHGKPLQN